MRERELREKSRRLPEAYLIWLDIQSLGSNCLKCRKSHSGSPSGLLMGGMRILWNPIALHGLRQPAGVAFCINETSIGAFLFAIPQRMGHLDKHL